jgi:protein gp37
MDHQWALNIEDQCRKQGVAFFFKQSSGRYPGKGDTLDGQIMRNFPTLPVLA